MRPSNLIDHLLSLHAAGLPLPSVAGGAPEDDKPAPAAPPDLNRLAAAVVTQHGDASEAIKALVSDNYALKQDLHSERNAHKETKSKIPVDGSRVLAGDDVKHYDAYKGFGTPKDVEKIRDERDALAARVATHERNDLLSDIASRAKVNPAVLRRLDSPTLVYETKTVKVNGKDTEAVFVKDGDSASVPFDDYAKSNWGEFLPALKPSGANPQVLPMRQPATPSRDDALRRAMDVRAAERTAPTATERHLAAVRGAI